MNFVSIKRVKRLLADFEGDAVIISESKNRYYYSGFTGTEATLLLTSDESYIFTDSRYHIQAKEQAEDFTLVDSAKNSVADFINEKKLAHVGFEEETTSVRAYNSLTQKLEKCTVKGINQLIKNQRKIKDEQEIEYIKKAAEIADSAFLYILDEIKPEKTEKELALMLEFYMRKNGADGLSFDTIFASGLRSAMPHGVASDKKIEKGDLVTIDFGCTYKGYCSDMTRTIAVGSISDERRKIYEIVLKAQLAAKDAIRQGALASEIDSIARGIISEAGYGKNFGHGLGHSLGLDIHEFPSLSPKSEETLASGMLITDEPGIYVEGLGGVRIEDLLLVTDDGCDNLTSSPKELIIL